jgi:hypothetical protein
MSSPEKPSTPDPYKTAGAQTDSNVQTAIANSVIGNPNVVGPTGSTTYSQSGDTQTITGPDGKSYQVPRYTQTNTLSPEQQQLYNLNTQTQQNIGQIGVDQSSRIGDILGKPVDYSDLQLDPNSFSADRQRVEQAMFQRQQPGMDQRRAALENNLTNQGFQRGTEAFTNAMNEYGQQENDMRLGITERGLGEQQGMYSMARDAAGYEMLRRTQQQNQPINAITALMSGSQVSMPNVPGYNPGQVANTDVSGAVYNSAALQNQQYQAEQAKQGAMWGGIAGLAGTGVSAAMGPGAFAKKLWG